MKTFLSIPSWLVVRLMLPFVPKTHPWHGRRFTLKQWVMGITDESLAFGAVMYVSTAFWVWVYFIIHPWKI